jgi:hypothetical protein
MLYHKKFLLDFHLMPSLFHIYCADLKKKNNIIFFDEQNI